MLLLVILNMTYLPSEFTEVEFFLALIAPNLPNTAMPPFGWDFARGSSALLPPAVTLGLPYTFLLSWVCLLDSTVFSDVILLEHISGDFLKQLVGR